MGSLVMGTAHLHTIWNTPGEEEMKEKGELSDENK